MHVVFTTGAAWKLWKASKSMLKEECQGDTDVPCTTLNLMHFWQCCYSSFCCSELDA